MFIQYKANHLTVLVLLTLASELLTPSLAKGLEVSSGQLIQTMRPDALFDSSTFTVNDFFDDAALAGQLRTNILEDSALGPPPLTSNTFTYAIHSADFVNHPDRNPGINSFPSNFSFDADDFIGTATGGRMGLGGVMRFDLPPLADGTPRLFISGDWTIEYDATRKDQFDLSDDPNKPIQPENFAVSGWFMRNHFDFPFITYELLNLTIITGPDAFYFSGELGWSREITKAFLVEKELYRVVSDFVLCAQDDDALAAHSAQQIPCVFPNITINGQTGTVNVPPPEAVNLAVDLGLASHESYPTADYFVVFVYQDVLYWLNQNFEWTTTAGPAHQGELVDFRSVALPSPRLPAGPLPSGITVPIYFAVDHTQNGVFDPPYRFAVVNLQINQESQ